MNALVTPARGPLALDAEARAVLRRRCERAVRRARRAGEEVLVGLTVVVDAAVDPSAVAFASRQPGEDWFCFEQPDRGGAALAALGAVRRLEASGPGRFAEVAAAWRALAGGAVAGSPDGPAGAGPGRGRRLRLRARGRRRAALGGLRRRRARRARGRAGAPRRRGPPHARRARRPRRRARGARATASRRAPPGCASARCRCSIPRPPGASGSRASPRPSTTRRPSPAPSSASAPARSRRSCSPARSRSTRPRRTTRLRRSGSCAPPSAPASCSAPAAATAPSWPRRRSCSCAARGCARRPSRSPARSAARPTRPSTTTSASSCSARPRTARSRRSSPAGSPARCARTRSGSTAPDEPAVIKVANIQHLATPIRAQLTRPVSVVELAGLLHPTPAVGGEPHAVGGAADPRARGHRPRLVRRARRLDGRERGRRVLRRAALRAAARRGGAALRRASASCATPTPPPSSPRPRSSSARCCRSCRAERHEVLVGHAGAAVGRVALEQRPQVTRERIAAERDDRPERRRVELDRVRRATRSARRRPRGSNASSSPGKRVRTWAGSPQPSGFSANGGGAGRWAPSVRKKSPPAPRSVNAADAEPPARPQHPRQLGRGHRVARGEHAAEGGEHDVEAVVLERQRLDVALDPVDRDAGGGRARPRGGEVLGRQVDPGHTAARPRGGDRDVAGPAGDVQHRARPGGRRPAAPAARPPRRPAGRSARSRPRPTSRAWPA